MSKNESKKIKVICLFSSAAFSAFTAVYPMLAIPSAMISIISALNELSYKLYRHNHLTKELECVHINLDKSREIQYN